MLPRRENKQDIRNIKCNDLSEPTLSVRKITATEYVPTSSHALRRESVKKRHISMRKQESTNHLRKYISKAERSCLYNSSHLLSNKITPILRVLFLILTCTGNLFNSSQFTSTINNVIGVMSGSSVFGVSSSSSVSGVSSGSSVSGVSSGSSVAGVSSSTLGIVGAMAAIIPPAWANETVNPCAKESWQLIYWTGNNKCYKIFSQVGSRVGRWAYYM